MKAWRNAASLIVAARHGQVYSPSVAATTHNYNLLCLKRHQKSKFMPGSYVFPGGIIESADADVKWRELFANLGYDGDSLARLIPRAATRPPIFQKQQNELPREISLRITAIRETFEESGLLMCKPRRDGDDISSWVQHFSIPQNELQIWQNKVHEDATLFFELCEKLQCCPNLWALHEWSNWLTPPIMHNSRYDTIFYLTCMQFKPDVMYEANEMEGLKWDTPENYIADSGALPPPQKYLITQLVDLKDIDSLLNRAMEYNKEGVQLYLPMTVQLRDGLVMLFPEDTMYPNEVETLKAHTIDKSDVTIAEYREMTPIKNRMELDSRILRTLDWKVVVSDNLSFAKKTREYSIGKTSEGQPQIKNKL